MAVLRMSLIVDRISWVILRFWSVLESSLNHCSLIRAVARRHRISTFDRRDWFVTCMSSLGDPVHHGCRAKNCDGWRMNAVGKLLSLIVPFNGIAQKRPFRKYGFCSSGKVYACRMATRKVHVPIYLPIVPCCALNPRESGRKTTRVGLEGNGDIDVDLSVL